AAAATAAVAGPGHGPATLRLERVVLVMRHGVRPPTKAVVAPAGMTDKPWPQWDVDYGQLTRHGHDATVLLGRWDRAHWAQQGLLTAATCPDANALDVEASYKQRTRDTGKAWLEGFAPDCKVPIEFPQSKQLDVVFHPFDAGAMQIDPADGLKAAEAALPAGGIAELVRQNAALFGLLDHAMGCCAPTVCESVGAPSPCGSALIPAGLEAGDGDGPSVGMPFSMASTVSQTFLMEYLDGKPMQDVAWGRLSREEISQLLEFHPIKYRFEERPAYVAYRAASPLVRRLLEAMQPGRPTVTALMGHDTNIADIGGYFDLHWQMPQYPRDDPPPAGALGFEVYADDQGGQFVKAFYRAQSMDQIRGLEALTASNAPAFEYLPIPGCSAPCRLADFDALARSHLVASPPAAATAK
ncbi:MAG TPA: histidine-type phosphatase, partial [Rhodanobacteraceae bacterium]|nr:histidine-type phosphatase [Rhodanobacteraceae bacterium]